MWLEDKAQKRLSVCGEEEGRINKDSLENHLKF
jgi:hypothetical protein